jgi:phosphoserine phosphatase
MDTPALPNGWQGFQSIIFDCDSTLSAIEGIDELARISGRYDEIRALTNAAMGGQVPLEEVYDRRLEMLRPTRGDIAAIADRYRDNTVSDAREVAGALQAAGKQVFIVSGGLLDAVRPFGAWLGVPDDHIRAVTVRYEAAPGSSQTDPATPHREDRYLSTVASPLTRANGKSAVVQEALSGTGGRSMLVGDGASDLAAAPDVDLFVGYTGVVERARVAAEADALVTGDSLAPILGLALTAAEEATLATTPYRDLIARSRAKIRAGELSMQKDPTP